jgi:hypothetical protein
MAFQRVIANGVLICSSLVIAFLILELVLRVVYPRAGALRKRCCTPPRCLADGGNRVDEHLEQATRLSLETEFGNHVDLLSRSPAAERSQIPARELCRGQALSLVLEMISLTRMASGGGLVRGDEATLRQPQGDSAGCHPATPRPNLR